MRLLRVARGACGGEPATLNKKGRSEATAADEEPVELTPEEEPELAEAIREVESGLFITAEELLARLRR